MISIILMNTTEAAKRIEMTLLRKRGHLKGWAWTTLSWTYNGEPSGKIVAKIATGSDGENYYAELDYKTRSRDTDEWRAINYRVALTFTTCRFGGRRWWFICPNTHCNRRNSILYQSGDYFICRKCARLTYESQSYGGKYAFLRNSFKADEYAETLKRWYYRGKPTRKHRRYLKMTNGKNELQRLEFMLKMLQSS